MKYFIYLVTALCTLGCRERYHDTPALARAKVHAATSAEASPTTSVGPPDEVVAALQGGTQVFADDFDRDMLGKDWLAQAKTWRLQDGAIINHHADNAGFWLQTPLPEGDVRIEFDVRSDSYTIKKGGKEQELFPGDLKCEAFNTKPEHQTGYIFIFGGWNNRVNRIARLEEHGDGDGARVEDGPSYPVVAGTTYRMKVVRVGSTVAWYANDVYLAHMTDDEPIPGRYFGFNNWRSRLTFDNVAVYSLAKKE